MSSYYLIEESVPYAVVALIGGLLLMSGVAAACAETGCVAGPRHAEMSLPSGVVLAYNDVPEHGDDVDKITVEFHETTKRVVVSGGFFVGTPCYKPAIQRLERSQGHLTIVMSPKRTERGCSDAGDTDRYVVTLVFTNRIPEKVTAMEIDGGGDKTSSTISRG